MTPDPLIDFCRGAIYLLDNVLASDRITLFLALRYDTMGQHYPHEVFSVNEGSLSFFADTLRYLTEGAPDRRPGVKAEEAKADIYWPRYRDWVRKHAAA